jgi:hypothetical protein
MRFRTVLDFSSKRDPIVVAMRGFAAVGVASVPEYFLRGSSYNSL